MALSEEHYLDEKYVMHTYARKPVRLVSGAGMHVFDDTGAAYLDFVGGVGAVSTGHCHLAVVKALEEQASRLIQASNYYYTEGRGALARTLSDLLNQQTPEQQRRPWQSFFANSGAEANECAIKLARLWAKKNKPQAGLVVTLASSFHGRTLATLAATAQPAKQEAFEPLPTGFTATSLNDSGALHELFSRRGADICAVMVECVQGESGVHPCDQGFLEEVRALTRAHGALLICDEIQCGIYRCGTYPFGFQHFGIQPDIVTVAKGIASGFPIGVCAAREEVARVFSPGDHGSTFGGGCLAVAAARATLGVLSAPGFAAQVDRTGAYLRERLLALPKVAAVRGLGLMVACDVVEDVAAAEVVAAGLGCGLLLNSTGEHTLRFLPPLVCTCADVDTLVDKLARIM